VSLEGEIATPTEHELPGLIAAYQVLIARWSVHNDILWRIIGFSLAAEVSAFVGLVNVGKAPGIHIILGCATAGIGIIGPISTRYAETGLLMDRMWLDRYEQVLLPRYPKLRQMHGAKLITRVENWTEDASSEERSRIESRRFGNSALAPVLNKAFDLLGQPSLIWTSIMALAGAVGFDVGIILGVSPAWLVWLLCVPTNLTMVVLWLLASGFVDRWLPKNKKRPTLTDPTAIKNVTTSQDDSVLP
jgi:hypothetical protein